MSTVLFTEQSTPPTPSINQVRVFFNPAGSLCSIDDTGTVTVYAVGLSPEQVEDLIGAMLVDSSSIDLTYNDTLSQISAEVIPSGVNHNALQNYVTNEHVDHSAVSVIAGTGLTGGGTIDANRTLALSNVGAAGTYKSVTTDVQGRVIAGTNPTTLAGYGIIDAQPIDSDLTAIANLATNGFISKTGPGTVATRTIVDGTGTTVVNGDGVSGNPSISLTNIGTAGTTGSATQVSQVTTDAQGRVSGATSVAIAIPSTQVTDFTEATQDAIGAALLDSASVDLVYNDVSNTISANIIPGGVNHNALQNYAANEHINHASVSISAGAGLSGGGDITASRTISMPNIGTAGTYRSVTTDAQGRVTAGTNPTTLAGYGITDAQPLDAELTAIAALTTNGIIVKTGAGAIATRSVDAGTGISITNGDGVSNNPTVSLTNVGTVGTFRSVTTDAQGRVTAGTNPTTLSGYGITDAQPLDADLTAVAALTGTGLVTRTAAGAMTTRTLTAGAGVSVSDGDGISGNPTVSLPNVGTAGTTGSATQTSQITTDAQGRVSGATSVAISIPSTQVTDFVEASQDSVGAALLDSASVDLVYNDAANTISANVIPGGVNHNALQNYVANQHIDHSTVNITAGTGLTGGGDITATRTISMPNVGTAGTFGNATQYPVITTDAQGRVSAVTLQAVPGGALTAKTSSVLTNNSNVTLTNIPQLSITLAANTTYRIGYSLIMQSVATTTGVAVSFGGGTTLISSIAGYVETSINTTTTNRLNFISATAANVFSGVAVINQNQIVYVSIIVVTGATGGTFIPQFRSEVNASQVTLSVNSSVNAVII